MKIFILAAMLIIVLLVLGFPPLPLLRTALWAVEGIAVLGVLFFLFALLLLLFSKKQRARFLRIESDEDNGMSYAVYESEGEELSNTFPTDRFLGKWLYRNGNGTIRVLRFRKSGWVFDRVSVIIVAIGLAAFVAIALLIAVVQLL